MSEFSAVTRNYGPPALETAHGDFPFTARRILTGTPYAPGEARGFAREHLADHPRLDDVLLVVSELVTNAVKHSDSRDGGTVTVTLTRAPGRARIEVKDEGSTGTGPSPVPTRPAWEPAESGHGLRLIAELSEGRWGHYRHRGARTVWVEIAT